MVARALSLVLLWVGLVASPAVAQQVRLQLEPPKLQVGQTGRMTLYFVGEKTRGAPQFEPPEAVKLEFDGSYQRFQTNGFDRTMIYVYRYRITALQEGDVQLGGWPFDLRDGKPVVAETARLQVVAREAFDFDVVELTAGFDTEQAWEGQVVVYEYELVARAATMGVDWRLPRFEGLRPTNSGVATSFEYTIDDADGGQISVYGGAIPLVASGTGDRTQPAALASVRVPVGQPSFMGLRQYRTERAVGPETPLVVRRLVDPPADFSGLVGEFEFRSKLDKTRAAVGQSVGWTLEVTGNGSLDGWSPPELAQTAGVTVYDADGVVQAAVRDGAYRSLGRFPRVLVPTAPGLVELPDLEVVSFSPTKGIYETHRIELGRLEVTEGREGGGDVQSFAGELPEVGEGGAIDFRGNYSWGMASAPRLVRLVPVLSGLAAFPAFALVFGVGLGRLRERLVARFTTEERPPTAAERLAHLPPDRPGRLAGMDAALRQVLAELHGVRLEALDRDAAVASLGDEVLRARVRRALQELDRARFADGPDGELATEVPALVKALEALGD